jgi:hypothetical protein
MPRADKKTCPPSRSEVRRPRQKKKQRTVSARAECDEAAPKETTHTELTCEEVGLVQSSETRLARHVMEKYSAIRAKQNDFIDTANSMAVDPHGPHSDAATKHPLGHCADANALIHQCEGDLSAMAAMITTSPHNTMSTAVGKTTSRLTSNITIVSRSWEEKFMHESSGCERSCCNSKSNTCFASMISNNGVLDPSFSLCEFYTESEYMAIEKTAWVWPVTVQPCILCLRNMVYAQFLQVRCSNSSVLASVSYASIGNMVGVPGEYCIENVFVSRPDKYEGIAVPIVIPSIVDYDVLVRNGTRSLNQRLPRPEHQRSSFFF